MYRARKPEVMGGRRKGGLKLRRKGSKNTEQTMLPDMPQNAVKGMGPGTSTYKGGGKGKPKGKAKVGVTNPIQGKGLRTPNTPMGNPLSGYSRSGKKSAGKKSPGRSGISTRKANRPMGNPLTDYVDPSGYLPSANQGRAQPGANPWQRSVFNEQLQNKMRRHAATHPYDPTQSGAREKRQNFLGRMAQWRPKMGMTANMPRPRR